MESSNCEKSDLGGKKWLVSNESISDIWEKLEQTSPRCSFWLEQSTEWYRSESEISRKSLSFVFRRNDRPIGAIRYWEGHTSVGRYLTSLGGPLWVPGEEEEVARQIAKSTKELRAGYLFILIHATPFFPIDLSTYGLKCLKPRGYSFLIDLTKDNTEIWNGIEKRSKGGVKKAEKNGLIVRSAENFDDWKLFHELQLAHSIRKGFQDLAYDLDSLKRLYNLSKDLKCELLICSKNDEILAATLWFLSGRLMVLHRNAWNDQQRLNANNLLFWESIVWGKNHDFLRIDLGGAPVPGPGVDSGIYHFKKSWGGSRIYHNRYYQGLLYGLTFRISKEVPIFGQLIRKVSNQII